MPACVYECACVHLCVQPEHIEVINESYMHNVDKGTDTSFIMSCYY